MEKANEPPVNIVEILCAELRRKLKAARENIKTGNSLVAEVYVNSAINKLNDLEEELWRKLGGNEDGQ